MANYKALISYLNKHKLILATAESCNAGQIMSTPFRNCRKSLFVKYFKIIFPTRFYTIQRIIGLFYQGI